MTIQYDEHAFSSRTEMLLGCESMERIRQAHVVIAGMGGVGSFALESLARMGIGALTVVDFDTVHASNINRQLLALRSTIGQNKVEAARSRIADINPACRVEALKLFIDEHTCPLLIAKKPHVIIDAIDSVNPKATLIEQAARAGIPIISCMGAATRRDPFAIRVADLSETTGCPLARFMRKRLRKRGIHKGVMCVFSTEPAPAKNSSAPPEMDAAERILDRGRPRETLGSICGIPAMFGLIAANEALRIIMGNSEATGDIKMTGYSG